MRSITDFKEITLCDFEYHYGTGGSSEGPPIVVCGCALELRSGREYRLWRDQLPAGRPPWGYGRDTLFVSYNACAELACYISPNWPMPPWILDLLVEFRQLANGILGKHIKRDSVTALRHYGLSAPDPVNKAEWQSRILRGEPFSEEERRGILDYCWEDVEPLRGLLAAILSKLPANLDRALYR